MSQFRRSVAVMATVAAVAAVPATASAAPAKAVSKTSISTVQKSVTSAKKSVKALKRAVRSDQSTVAKRQLKLARSQTANAARVARTMSRSVTTDAAANTAAQALTIAGTQYDALLETLTGLVADGTAQSLIAGAIRPTIAGKEQVLETMTALLSELPGSTQPTFAAVIAALGAGDATEVVNLDNALNIGTLPATITGLVTECLATAMAAIESAHGHDPGLPADAARLTSRRRWARSSRRSPAWSATSSRASSRRSRASSTRSSSALPIVGGGQAGGGIGGIGDLGSLLGGILGGGSSTVPGAGDIGTLISDLLGGVLGGGSGSGSGPAGGPVAGVIGTVTGIISSLLGGLLGGGGLLPST